MDPIIGEINRCRTEQDLTRLLIKSGFSQSNAHSIMRAVGRLAEQDRVLVKLAALRDGLRVA